MEDMLVQYLMSVKKRFTYCHRCGWKWVRHKKDRLPQRCPKCNSPYWNKPRKKKSIL